MRYFSKVYKFKNLSFKIFSLEIYLRGGFSFYCGRLQIHANCSTGVFDRYPYGYFRVFWETKDGQYTYAPIDMGLDPQKKGKTK